MKFCANLLALVIPTVLLLGCSSGQDGTPKNGAAVSASDPPVVDPNEPDQPNDPADPNAEKGGQPPVDESSGEDGYGHLRLRFVYDGDAPKAAAKKVTKDTEACGTKPLVDESLVVNGENGGLANVIVWLYLKRGATPPAAHPSYAETAEAGVRLDNEFCRFEPYVTLLRTSQTLIMGNKDTVGHNTNIMPIVNPGLNQTIAPGTDLPTTFSEAESLPSRVSCNIHPWMTAWMMISDHPYVAKSDENGNVELKNLPDGEWTFRAWHELPGYVSDLELGGEPTRWSKGRFEVTIASNIRDLGDVKLKPAIFADSR